MENFFVKVSLAYLRSLNDTAETVGMSESGTTTPEQSCESASYHHRIYEPGVPTTMRARAQGYNTVRCHYMLMALEFDA